VSLAMSLANVGVYKGKFAGTSTFGTLVAMSSLINNYVGEDMFVPHVLLLVMRIIANKFDYGSSHYGSYAISICRFVNETVKSTENMSSTGFERFLAHLFTLKVRCLIGKVFLFSVTFSNKIWSAIQVGKYNHLHLDDPEARLTLEQLKLTPDDMAEVTLEEFFQCLEGGRPIFIPNGERKLKLVKPQFKIETLDSKLKTQALWKKRLSSPCTTVVGVCNQKGFDVHFRSVDKKPVDVFVEGEYADAMGGGDLKVADLRTKFSMMKEVCKYIGVDEADTVLCILTLKETIPTEDEVCVARVKANFGGMMDRDMILHWCGPSLNDVPALGEPYTSCVPIKKEMEVSKTMIDKEESKTKANQ
jgi:hypothetical protein